MKHNNKLLKVYYFLITFVLLSIIIIAALNFIIESSNNDRAFNDVRLIPENRTGLLLGTSKYLIDGSPNPYFRNRIKAAAKLYHANKIEFIILSGDNSEIYYNEPEEMRKELLKEGIPGSRLFPDYAGFRTLDAVIRCRWVFGQKKFTVISQEFHNKRALYIARQKGIDAIAYNAVDISTFSGLKTNIREIFARVKVFIDLFILDKKARFLGKKIYVGEKSLKERLGDFRSKWLELNSEETALKFESAINEIGNSGILDSCYNVGDTLPELKVQIPSGDMIDLKKISEKRPLVLSWYRGGWSPYCTITLEAIQEVADSIEEAGAFLLLLSPETDDNVRNTVNRHMLKLSVIHDMNNEIAKKFGITYKIPDDMLSEFEGKLDLSKYNGNELNELPLTATYIIDRSGIIRFADLNADYRQRLEPSELLHEISKLNK